MKLALGPWAWRCVVLTALALPACAASRSRSEHFFEAGRAAEARGETDEAVVLYRRAVAEAPQDIEYRIALVLAEEQARRAGTAPLASPAALHADRVLDPLGATPVDLRFQDASLEEIFRTLGRLAGINILFDEAYRDVRVSVDLRGQTLRSALELLARAHGLFLVIEP